MSEKYSPAWKKAQIHLLVAGAAFETCADSAAGRDCLVEHLETALASMKALDYGPAKTYRSVEELIADRCPEIRERYLALPKLGDVLWQADTPDGLLQVILTASGGCLRHVIGNYPVDFRIERSRDFLDEDAAVVLADAHNEYMHSNSEVVVTWDDLWNPEFRLPSE